MVHQLNDFLIKLNDVVVSAPADSDSPPESLKTTYNIRVHTLTEKNAEVVTVHDGDSKRSTAAEGYWSDAVCEPWFESTVYAHSEYSRLEHSQDINVPRRNRRRRIASETWIRN